MTPLRQRMIEDMQLRGLSDRTQVAYVAAVRQLAEHYGKSPDQLSDEDLRQYFLYLTNDKKASRSGLTIALCAFKFFYEQTLQQAWPTLSLVRPPRRTSCRSFSVSTKCIGCWTACGDLTIGSA